MEVEKNVHEEVRALLLQENVTNKMVTPEHTAPAPIHELKSPTRETNIWEALRKQEITFCVDELLPLVPRFRDQIISGALMTAKVAQSLTVSTSDQDPDTSLKVTMTKPYR